MRAKRNKLFAGLINQTFEGFFFCLFDLLCLLGNLVDINVEPRQRQSGIVDQTDKGKGRGLVELKTFNVFRAVNSTLWIWSGEENEGKSGGEKVRRRDLFAFQMQPRRRAG